MAEGLLIYCNIKNILVEEEGCHFEKQEDNKEPISRSVEGKGHVGNSENPVISLSVPNDYDLDAASPNSSFASVEIECGASRPEEDETSFSINGRSGSGRRSSLATPSCAGRRYGMHYMVHYTAITPNIHCN